MKKSVIIGAGLSLLSSLAFAEYIPNSTDRIESAGDFYMSAHMGITDFGKSKLDGPEFFGGTELGSGSNNYDIGYHGMLAYGYHFDPACLSLEGQFRFDRVPLKGGAYNGESYQASGSFQVFSLYMNALYEFINIGVNTHPYIGIGTGLNHMRLRINSITEAGGDVIVGIPRKTSNRFGYQFIVGLLMHKRENFAVDLSYRANFISAVPGVKGRFGTQHVSIGINFDVGETL